MNFIKGSFRVKKCVKMLIFSSNYNLQDKRNTGVSLPWYNNYTQFTSGRKGEG